MVQITPHLIENGHWQVGVLPRTGGALAFGRIKHGESWVDFLRPTPETSYEKVSDCASFILVPWANRLRDARFRFRGKDYQLRSNNPAGTANHGVGRNFAWKVEAADASKVILSFNSADHPDINFPFRFAARLEYALESKRFTILTMLRNEDKQAMPGAFGHHPYFQRALGKPTEMVSVQIPCTQYFELENSLPSAAPKPIPAALDFRHLRALGPESIDDCLTGREDHKPVRFVYGGEQKQITMHCDEIFQCLDLFTPPGKDFFALEPVTNANDGFNLYEKGIAGTGVFVLEPGEERKGAIHFEVDD